jgi:hypothetical protein
MKSRPETTKSHNEARSKFLSSVADSKGRLVELAREKSMGSSPEPELSSGTELKLRSVVNDFTVDGSDGAHARIDIRILNKYMASRLNTYYVEIIRSNVYYGDITGANKETLMVVWERGQYEINGHEFLEADDEDDRVMDDVMGGGGKRRRRKSKRKSKKRKSKKRKSKKRKSKRKSKKR